MPLYRKIKMNNHIEVLIWQITEDLNYLEQQITWYPSDKAKYESIHHEEKKKEFLALRNCLKTKMGNNPEVFYEASGKPYLSSSLYVSFSHTKNFAAVAFSQSFPVGVDIEITRPKVERIAEKFLRKEELKSLDEKHALSHLHYYWGIKECVVKITGNKKISFRNEMRTAPFSYSENNMTSLLLTWHNTYQNFTFYSKKIGTIFITYGWQDAE